MKSITSAPLSPGIRVVVRADFNMPVDDSGKVRDTYRLDSTKATLDFLIKAGAIITIISHIESDQNTLLPVVPYLTDMFPGSTVSFCADYGAEYSSASVGAKPGDMILCENLRLHEGEKANDGAFAQSLTVFGDIYCNEAFSVSHRRHASVDALPRLYSDKAYAGIQFFKEIEALSKAAHAPAKPFVFILGGAKFDTKIPLLDKFSTRADTVMIGGALAHTVYKERGYEMGISLCADGFYDTKKYFERGNALIPETVVIQSSDKTSVRTDKPDSLVAGERIVDAAPDAMDALIPKLAGAQTIIWNGPLGSYEEGFVGGTVHLAELIHRHAPAGATTIIGGGDTVAAVKGVAPVDSFTLVSTGGGAMLDYLVNETLPGIEALDQANA